MNEHTAQIGDQVFDENFVVYMVVDKSSGLIKIMQVYPNDDYKSYSVYNRQLHFIKNSIWEVKL